MMASCLCNRDLVFFCYGRNEVYVSLIELNTIIEENAWATVSDMYRCVLEFCDTKGKSVDINNAGKALVSFCATWLESRAPKN